MHVLDLLTILCTVSMTGTEFTVSAIVNPALGRLDQAAWLKTTPVLARAMGRAMPFWYTLGLLLIGAEAFFRRHAPSHLLLDGALLLWVAGIAYSVTMLVPINNRIAASASAAVASTAADHQRWDALHRWRVALLGVATVCLLSGTLHG